jgi:DNA repair exonuclease SbcCD ATPase subunit
MIKFKTLRWKNFLSTGNTFTEIDFQRSPTTLVVGHNGAGKSTMLDALSFALFGRAHRNISKPQLVNSINNKHTLVEVTFDVGQNQFIIKRGIKPSVFEIWKNGDLINQDSHAKEYQKVLEQNIIKLNHKSFHQIVVLGSSSFVPFMQLTTVARREVIEDLLDINVFSKMNQILKEKNSGLREKIKDCSHTLDILKTRVDAQKKYIKDVEAINEEQRGSKTKLINDLQKEINELQSSNTTMSTKAEEYQAECAPLLESLTQKQTQLVQFETQFKQDMKAVVKNAKFFEENDVCPTCTQEITDDIKQDKIAGAKIKAKELQSALSKLDLEMKTTAAKLTTVTDKLETERKWQSQIHANNQTITRLQKSITDTLAEIDKLSAGTSDLSQAVADLTEMKKQSDSIVEMKLELNEQYTYNGVIGEMLKDTGIKTKIIKQYLPVINKLVNQYLQVLDFFVHFDLDETFAETIRSRHRDSFTYDSFSEGEKQRIDLALLFTWRMIAKMKNSVSTNLLILDETFDSSLDYEGVDNLMKIIYTLGNDTNVFVISHKGDILDGKFESKIEFIKEKNFSQIKG